jgi:hypothetical protein
MSFFVSCPEQGASACPDKSGHTRNAELTMIRHVGRCPDLLGPAGALLRGLPWRDLAGAYKRNGNKAVVQFIELSPCMPGLGQGHETKKDIPVLLLRSYFLRILQG